MKVPHPNHARGGKGRRMRRILGLGFVLIAATLLALMARGDDPRSHRSRESAGDGDTDAGIEAGGRASVETPDPSAAPRDDARGRRLVVRDLFDASPLPYLELTVETEPGGPHAVSTGGDGTVVVDAAVVEDAIEWRCGSDTYDIASSASQVDAEGEIWCLAHGELRGRVVLESAPIGGPLPDLGTVQLSLSPAFVTAREFSPVVPGRWGWTRRSAVRDLVAREYHPDGNGTFLLRVPKLPGAALVARARGYCAAWEELDAAAWRGSREVVLSLRAGSQIQGTAYSQAGTPLAGTRVHVYIVQRGTITDFDYASIGRARAGSFTCKRSVKDDWVVYKLHYSATVDASGRWSVDLGADGEAHVVCYPDGHAPIDVALGRASDQYSQVDLVVEERLPSRVLILADGEPLPNRTVLLIDLSLMDVQPGFDVKTNAAGVLATTFLTRGRPYAMRVRGGGGHGGYVNYTGQGVIDLADCESSLDDFLGR